MVGKKSLPKIRFNSLEFEISVLYTIILGVILVVFSGMLYVMLFYTLYTELDNDLRLKAEKISQSINIYLEVKGQEPQALMFAIEKTIASQGKRLSRWWIMGFESRWFRQIEEMDLEEDYVHFVSAQNQSLAKSENMAEDLVGLFLRNAEFSEQPSFKNISYNRRKIRLINYPFVYKDARHTIQVGVFQKPIAEAILAWLNSVMMSVPIVLLLTSFVGRHLARRILNPVKEITVTATKISSENLSARVKTPHSYEEMERLSGAFNDMISRLEKSFRHIEEFSYQVAHELKTPLTILKGESEVGLLSRNTVEEYQEILKINLEETDKMLKIIGDLLYLARLDYQPGFFKFEEINLTEFLNEIAQQSQILAAGKNLLIETYLPLEKLIIKADPLHLRRLFLNLMDNALKFTPSGGED